MQHFHEVQHAGCSMRCGHVERSLRPTYETLSTSCSSASCEGSQRQRRLWVARRADKPPALGRFERLTQPASIDEGRLTACRRVPPLCSLCAAFVRPLRLLCASSAPPLWNLCGASVGPLWGLLGVPAQLVLAQTRACPDTCCRAPSRRGGLGHHRGHVDLDGDRRGALPVVARAPS